MSKLTKEQIEFLTKIGIEGTTDEEVRPTILSELKKVDVEDVDTDPIDDLIAILTAFDVVTTKEEKVEKPTKATKKVVKEEEDEEVDAEEAEEVPKAKKKEKEVETPKVEKKKVKKVIEEESEEDVAALVEEVKTKKVTEKKEAKPKVEKKISKSDTERYDGENTAQVEKLKVAMKNVLKQKDIIVQYKQLSIAARLNNSISGRTIFSMEKVVFKGGEIFFDVVFTGLNLFAQTENLPDLIRSVTADSIHDKIVCKNNKYPSFKNINIKEIDVVIDKNLINLIVEKLSKLDSKLNTNRKKMQDKIEE